MSSQSHWSCLIDLLFDVNINVKRLNAREVIGYVAFCSFETNGTTLPVGILTGYLCTGKRRRAFKDSIISDGMYYTLLCNSIRRAKARHTTVYGSSVNPRHVGHNRSYCVNSTNPVAGDSQFSSGFDPDSSSDELKQKIKARCAQIEKRLIDLCARTTRTVLNTNKSATSGTEENGKKEKNHLKEFLAQIQVIAGKGCSGMYCLNFMQLAGYFGFVPIKILSTSTVETKVSGGFKFIEMLYPGISPGTAQKYFIESTLKLQKLFGSAMTFAFSENLLCELYRDRNGSNPKKDVTFFFDHRSNEWNGLQNFFRLKIDSSFKMDLEMLGVPNTKTVEDGHIKLLSWIKGLTSNDGMMNWIHRNDGIINYKSELVATDEVAKFYSIRPPPQIQKRTKRKRRRGNS